MISYIMKKIVGSQNERDIKKLGSVVDVVNEYEAALLKLSNSTLKEKTDSFKNLILKRTVLIQMRKDNLFKKNVKKANPEYFTGLVKMKELSNVINSQEQKIFHVTFKNGSRTKLHYHTGGQILIVTKGKGSLVLFNRFGKN